MTASGSAGRDSFSLCTVVDRNIPFSSSSFFFLIKCAFLWHYITLLLVFTWGGSEDLSAGSKEI